MLKERGEVTVKESWQHRSKSAVEQGHFSSQQVSAALWGVCTRGLVQHLGECSGRCISLPLSLYNMAPVVLAACEAQHAAVQMFWSLFILNIHKVL